MGILLVQDLIVIPMLIIIGLLGNKTPSLGQLGSQLAGASAIIAMLFWTLSRETRQLRFGHLIQNNPELQVFAVLLVCLGMALLTGMVHLSTALGDIRP